ncbi:hypothetical protein V8F06_009018 [Rhypophila decipiens]
MVTVSSTSSRSTTAETTSTARVYTPSSDGHVFNDAATPVENLTMGNLRLSSPTPSTVSDIYSATPLHGSNGSPDTGSQPAGLASTPSPSVQIMTPRTSTAPSAVSEDGPAPSTSSSSTIFPPGLSIDFSFSISTQGSPSRTPFPFTGPDFPLPSIENPSTPPRQPPAMTSPVPSSAGHSRDDVASMASQVRRIQINGDSRSPPLEQSEQPAMSSRYLSPSHGRDDDEGRQDGSPGSSRPSPGRRRRSSSQMNQAPHNVQDEEPPEDEFNNPTFQRAFTDSRNMMAKLKATLGSSDLHLEPDSTIRRLRKKAGKLAEFRCPPTRTVGFVGDSGVGKSSLLNSLLDCKGLARTSNSGTACTCVVTEYHYHEHDNFTIHVDLFTKDELQIQLTEMVQAYRRHHLGPETADRDEQQDIADRAKVANDTCQAMFRSRKTFADGQFVLGNQPEEAIVSTMIKWADQTLENDLSGTTTVGSKAECSRLLVDFTSERPDSQLRRSNRPQQTAQSLWPFIKKIRVYLSAHILSKGLILVDLPGLRDLNSARQNITERYILKCDEIFAVCCIGRAVTDVGVKAVFDLARQARLSNVGIVCTKSDDINPEEALTDWKKSKGRELEERMDRLKAAEEELTTMKARVHELREFQQDDDLLDEEIPELERLQSLVPSRERAVETLKLEQQRYLISTRNGLVRMQLLNLYKDTIPGGDLKVFCVSNKLYWEHRQAARDKALPWLELSGIIPLRKHCIAMVSNSQLRIARNYMENDVRSLVSSVELWVQSGAGTQTAEEKEAVHYVLDAIEEKLKKDLTGRITPFSRLSKDLAKEFREQIYARRQITRWTRQAVDASSDWAGWHHSTYSAFCRNYGHHCTNAVGSRNWNQEAMERMVRDMTTPWTDFCHSITDEHIGSMTTIIEEAMDWAIELVDDEILDEGEAEILDEVLETRQGLLTADLEDACQKFETGLRILWTNVSSSHRTSLMGENMETAYRECQAESGTGSDSRRKSIIRRQLSDEGMFEDIMTRFKTQFRDLVTDLQKAVQRAAKSHVAEICQTMNMLRDENVITESERDGEFRKRVEDEVARVRAQLLPRD